MENLTKDEAFVGFGAIDLASMKRWAEEIAGSWNGDEPEGEDKAMCAKEIGDKCNELEALLQEMASYL